MDYAALSNEIASDPTGKGYAAFSPDAPGTIAEMLNAPNETMAKSRFITGRTILAECGTLGPSILDALDAAAASNSAVKWAVKFLAQDGGVDVGHPQTFAMIDQLTGAGLTSEQAAALKALAIQPASRAEALGLGTVTMADVIAALGA